MKHLLGKCYLWLMHKYYQRQSQYTRTGKVALCCIGKMENDYIREYVEYYQELCFDKIFLYDNNDIDGEKFEDVIGDYIQNGFVDIVDFRGRKMCQCDAYQDCYDRHNKEYDWIAFLDCDEFLTFADGGKNIHNFLFQKKFSKFQLMHINWMVFGDNEMLDNDGRPVVERFANPIFPLDFKCSFPFPQNNHIKTIIRGGLAGIQWGSFGESHTPLTRYYRCCNANGNIVESNSPYHPFNHSVAYIRHYSTKTIGEWVKTKMRRGYPDQTKERMLQTLSLDAFWGINSKTAEKQNYAQSILTEHL